MSEFTGSFYIAIASIGSTAFGLLLAHCFRLKYSNVKFCGFSCTRDIALENAGYDIEMQHNENSSPRIRDIIPPLISPPIPPNIRRNSSV
jgi:hypothetical protein